MFVTNYKCSLYLSVSIRKSMIFLFHYFSVRTNYIESHNKVLNSKDKILEQIHYTIQGIAAHTHTHTTQLYRQDNVMIINH